VSTSTSTAGLRVSKASTPSEPDRFAPDFTRLLLLIALILASLLFTVLDNLHALTCARKRLASASAGIRAVTLRRTHSAAAPAMISPKHAAAAIDAVVDSEEVVVAWELVLVYAVQSTLLGRTAEAVAVCNKTAILQPVSGTSENELPTYPCFALQASDGAYEGGKCSDKERTSTTYRLLSSFSLRRIDGIMVLCNVQVQKVLIGKVVLTV
jgi:hypothetical protein